MDFGLGPVKRWVWLMAKQANAPQKKIERNVVFSL
jgi:hypothetical protein